MHCKYINCSKCGKLGPSPGSFYKKGYLSEKAKKIGLCCLEKIKKYKLQTT